MVKSLPKGRVIWITGISGAGKTTFASFLNNDIRHLGGQPILLDGDSLREILKLKNKSYSKHDRLSLSYVYAKLCKYLSDQGFIVIIATIALFHEIHLWNRINIKNYTEIFINTELKEIINRSVSTIYSEENLESEIAGVNFPVEFPKNPDEIITGSLEDFAVRSKKLATQIMKN